MARRGAGVQRGAGLPMRPSRVGRKCLQNFHFRAEAGAVADAEERTEYCYGEHFRSIKLVYSTKYVYDTELFAYSVTSNNA